jgi:hypothetical protein
MVRELAPLSSDSAIFPGTVAAVQQPEQPKGSLVLMYLHGEMSHMVDWHIKLLVSIQQLQKQAVWMPREQQPERPKGSLVLMYLHGEEYAVPMFLFSTAAATAAAAAAAPVRKV